MWLYCEKCDGEFHQSSKELTSIGSICTRGVYIHYFCSCGNNSPLVDMAEIGRLNPALRKEAEKLKVTERKLLRELEDIRGRLKELGYD